MTSPEVYRETIAQCPVCAVPMELRTAGDATIDVCPTCRGLWLDWFDGDTLTLVEHAMPLSRREGVGVPSSLACPRCTRPLETRAHETSGPPVWRCTECAGSFLPRPTVEALLIWAAANAETAPPSLPPRSVRDATLLDRLRRALRSLFPTG
jgi:Zn-finger nucleic acid-binding protein